MSGQRKMPLSRRLMFSLGPLLLGACATLQEPDCATIDCVFQREVERPLYVGCVKDLFRYSQMNKRQQKAVRDEYRYPLTSTESYLSFKAFGGVGGPSPESWCRGYARVKARAPIAINASR